MKPNKDLVIIDNRLKSKDNNIFPLSPTHRKELRNILSRNIGDLKIKLNLIKDRKFEEFKQKNKTKFDKIKKEKNKEIKIINEEYLNMQTTIINLVKQFIEQDKSLNKDENPFIFVHSEYGLISNLNIKGLKNQYRRYELNDVSFNEFIQKRFNEKFNQNTQKVYDLIELYSSKYEEAIVFEDLLLVKDIYFKIKELKTEIEKLDKIKV